MAYQRVTMRDRAGGATCIPGVRRYAARMTSAPPSATDVLIVGAGIAGAGLAAMLAPHRRVTIIEAEEAPGVHATGRSAAFWHATYGGAGGEPLSTERKSGVEGKGVAVGVDVGGWRIRKK